MKTFHSGTRVEPALATAASTEATRPAAVSVRNLTKVYQARRGEVTALRDVSLEVPSGEIVVLLGPSGCGKTTLLRCVAGLEFPTAGDILVHGRTVYSSDTGIAVPPEKRNLSMVFQSYALWPHMTVFQNVAYPLKISRVKPTEIAARVQKTLALAGLEAYAANYPGQLSGGQQQRVALARALVANDGLILFDEPLSNLDAKVRERLRDELLAMQQEFGFTAIYVTHDQVEAAALADRIAVMEVGQVGQLGAPTEVFNFPRTAYVADFVGCTNDLAGTVTGAHDGRVEVATEIGLVVGACDADAVTGQAARVMFRPEHARPVAADPGGPNVFTGRVERSVFLGAHVEYQLSVGGRRLVVRSMEGDILPTGATVTFALDPRLTRVFVTE